MGDDERPNRYGDEYEESVQLSDGQKVLLRTIRPSDKQMFLDAFERLSPESRYARFMTSKTKLSEQELRYLTEIDGIVSFGTDVRGKALAEIGGETVKPRLMTLFKDSSSSVRAAAFNSLCTTDSGNIDYYIRSALSDSDFVVQSEAIDKIGEKKLVKYLPQLMTIIQMKKRADSELKRSVIAAAAEFLGEDKAGINKEAEDILYHGVLDKNYLVSYEAAKFYKEKIGTDRTGYINYPNGLFSERKIKSLLNQYRKNPIAKIYTDRGEIELELLFDVAPLTVGNFIKLAVEGFYDGVIFHRVIPNFVVQGGDPRGDGFGGPGYTIRCEYSNLTFTRGSVGMAHSGKDSGGSQFFIALTPLPHLDARYTLFGQVTSGMDIVDIIRRGDTIKHIMIQTEEDK